MANNIINDDHSAASCGCVNRRSENIWKKIKQVIKAAKAAKAYDLDLLARRLKVSALLFKVLMCAADGRSDFSWERVFSWGSRSMRAGSESQIPQGAGCVFWQQWKRKTQTHMCLCAENMARKKSLEKLHSWMLPMSIWFSSAICAVGCLLFPSGLHLIYFFSFLIYPVIMVLHAYIDFVFMWSLHSSSSPLILLFFISMAAALFW